MNSISKVERKKETKTNFEDSVMHIQKIKQTNKQKKKKRTIITSKSRKMKLWPQKLWPQKGNLTKRTPHSSVKNNIYIVKIADTL